MVNDALVLAGGGVAGIAWEIGVLLGIQDNEPAVAEKILSASLLLGTSAGSTVAAQVGSGAPLQDLFELQLSESSTELKVDLDLAGFGAMMAAAVSGAASPEESRQRIGRIARESRTPSPAARRAVIDARLPDHAWSQRQVQITAVDTETGELRVFDRNSGVSLVDAVMASCAVPGVWPAVEIDGRFYMDGGMRTVANADLAAGADRVLIIVPAPATSPNGPTLSAAELDALSPAAVQAIFADPASVSAFGSNPLDPQVRGASAVAGRDLGRRMAAKTAEFWSG